MEFKHVSIMAEECIGLNIKRMEYAIALGGGGHSIIY